MREREREIARVGDRMKAAFPGRRKLNADVVRRIIKERLLSVAYEKNGEKRN